MDAREEQAREILEEMGINPDQYWPKKTPKESFSKKPEMTADERRARSLTERLAKASPFGGKVVERALERGMNIVFSDEMGKQAGTCTQKNVRDKEIVLNSRLPDEQLMTAMVRLARYTEQGLAVNPQMTMHGAIMTARAKEADAKAYEAAAAYEMRETEPAAYQSFFEKNLIVAGCYYYAMRDTKDEGDSLRRTAKAWYDVSNRVRALDETLFDYMAAAGAENRDAFRMDVSASMLADVFSYKGVSYMEKRFLTSDKANFITENQAARIENIEKNHRLMFYGKNPEKGQSSAGHFYVRKENGAVCPPPKPVSVFARISAHFGR